MDKKLPIAVGVVGAVLLQQLLEHLNNPYKPVVGPVPGPTLNYASTANTADVQISRPSDLARGLIHIPRYPPSHTTEQS